MTSSVPTLAAIALCAACAAPSETTTLQIAGHTLTPVTALFAIHAVTVDNFLTGTETKDFGTALVIDEELECDSIPSDCEVPLAPDAAVMTVEVAVDYSLFGPPRLGDYELPGDSTWRARFPQEDGTVAELFATGAGNVDVARLDDGGFAATYSIEVLGELAEGGVAADSCEALVTRLEACE